MTDGDIEPAADADAAIAQLRACYDGTGPLLTASYKHTLVGLIDDERSRYRSQSEVARLRDAVTRALAVLEGVGSESFEWDDGVAADLAATILGEVAGE